MNTLNHTLNRIKRYSKKNILPHILPHLIKLRINTYAPYVGAGVKIEHMDLDQGLCVVTMGLTALNKNVVGTQFGGSLYSMVDPFYMLMLMQQLGDDYVVWDKSAHIDFVRPGSSKVTARMKLPNDEASIIKDLAKNGEAVFRDYVVDIVDEQNKTVATVKKHIYIRLRKHSNSQQKSRIPS